MIVQQTKDKSDNVRNGKIQQIDISRGSEIIAIFYWRACFPNVLLPPTMTIDHLRYSLLAITRHVARLPNTPTFK